jgi:hypothetical protein
MTPADSAIRARRRLTNKLIAAHAADRLRPFFATDMKLIVGDGALVLGGDAVVAAFAAQFRDPDFVTYERTPETVTPDADETRAAEQGSWVATWRSGVMSGVYLAVWRKVTGQWVIESELYVTLA